MTNTTGCKVKIAFVIAVAVIAGPAHAEQTHGWPTQVSATYAMSFTGLGDVGKFNFQARIEGTAYTVSGQAEVKIPMVYKWSGNLTGGGTLQGDEAKPSSYLFTSQGKPIIGAQKNNSIRFNYRDGMVTSVSIVPPSSPGGEGYVPLLPAHLKDAMDPLTAIIATSRAKGANPCGHRIPMFDGKQRFDLLMSPTGQQRVTEARPSGQPAIGYLCRVRYAPIGGYKSNEDTRHMMANNGVEVALRPVPSANLLVPYRIVVPTRLGTATMTLQRMEIVMPGQKQIALVH